jgi:hypothetical protein
VTTIEELISNLSIVKDQQKELANNRIKTRPIGLVFVFGFYHRPHSTPYLLLSTHHFHHHINRTSRNLRSNTAHITLRNSRANHRANTDLVRRQRQTDAAALAAQFPDASVMAFRHGGRIVVFAIQQALRPDAVETVQGLKALGLSIEIMPTISALRRSSDRLRFGISTKATRSSQRRQSSCGTRRR